MKKKSLALCAVALLLTALFLPALQGQAYGQTLPDGFEFEVLADGLNQPKGIVSPPHRAGAGQFGHDLLYVAVSGANVVVTVDKNGAGAQPFASTGPFPVGVAFFGGPFGEFLYVGNASANLPGTFGIERIDPEGNTTGFALEATLIAGLDFGRGAFGKDLYAGNWTQGLIRRVDPGGNTTIFAQNPGTQTRYLKFSHGGPFGTLLYYTDFKTGDIYRVDPDGNVTLFAQTGDIGLEGLDFSPGCAFGHYMYTGSLYTGNVYQVAPDGTVTLWGWFDGAADIHFEPGNRGGFVMYIASGRSKVYAVFAD
jgi:hypothetical protein